MCSEVCSPLCTADVFRRLQYTVQQMCSEVCSPLCTTDVFRKMPYSAYWSRSSTVVLLFRGSSLRQTLRIAVLLAPSRSPSCGHAVYCAGHGRYVPTSLGHLDIPLWNVLLFSCFSDVGKVSSTGEWTLLCTDANMFGINRRNVSWPKMKVRSGEVREWLASIALPLLFEQKGRLCCSWNREMEAVRALSNTYRRRKSDGTVSALWEIFRLPLRHAFYTERPESFHSRTPTSLKKKLRTFSYVHSFMFRVSGSP